jgi:hypothetical protein
VATESNRISQTDYNLRDVLDLHTREVLLATNCHGIATVQSFDAETQTVTATMNYKKKSLKADSSGVYREVYESYPLITSCPVVVLRGGLARMTFPIAPGDICVILFNDRDMDRWFSGGQVMPPETNRLHYFTDAIALIGISSLANSLLDYDEERAVISNAASKVALGPVLIEISNELTSLGEIMTDLMTTMTTLLTAMSSATAGTIPATVAAPAAAANASIALITAKITGLLE